MIVGYIYCHSHLDLNEFNDYYMNDLNQFLIAPDIFSKLNVFEIDCPKFDQENSILDYLSVDWEYLIKSDNWNVGQSFVSFPPKFNSI